MKLQNVGAIFLKQTVETSIKLKMIETDKLSLFFSNEFPFNKDGLAEFVNTFVKKFYKKGNIDSMQKFRFSRLLFKTVS